MKTIVVIKKRSDFIEIDALINYFNTSHLCLCMFSTKELNFYSKTTFDYLSKKYRNRFKKFESFYFEDKIKNGKDMSIILNRFITDKTVVAIPLANGPNYIEASRILKKNNKIILCHISDGILDDTPSYLFYLIKRKFNLLNILKYLFSTIKLFLSKSEHSFSIWSNHSPFSKKTIHINLNFDYQLEIRNRLKSIISSSIDYKKLILLIPSQKVSKDVIIKHFNLEKNLDRVVVSTYTGEVIFNDKKYLLEGPLTAEELLQTNYFQEVYAGTSTAAFYAKKLNPDIDVSMICTIEQLRFRTKLETVWLEKKAIKHNIKYQFLTNI